jgi:hypothetical protein
MWSKHHGVHGARILRPRLIKTSRLRAEGFAMFQTFLLCFVIFLSGCIALDGTQDLGMQCQDQTVFGSGRTAPWLPKWSTIHRYESLHTLFEEPVLIGLADSAYACQPDSWETSDSIIFENLGAATVFVCFSDEAQTCDGQFRRHTFNVVTAYGPPADADGSDAIGLSDESIDSWAVEFVEFEQGDGVETQYQSPPNALGLPGRTTSDVTVFGAGGSGVLRFCPVVSNREGADFAVFENGVNDSFLELAFVEVSSDGVHFIRFPNAYLGLEPVGPYEGHDAELISGLAGRFKFGFGTQFDLGVLDGHSNVAKGLVDLESIEFIRLVDIIGDGSTRDSFLNPIFDPFPTRGTAGFDLIGVGVLNEGPEDTCDL